MSIIDGDKYICLDCEELEPVEADVFLLRRVDKHCKKLNTCKQHVGYDYAPVMLYPQYFGTRNSTIMHVNYTLWANNGSCVVRHRKWLGPVNLEDLYHLLHGRGKFHFIQKSGPVS